MGLKKQLIKLLISFSLTTALYAGNTLTVTLINNSKYELIFERAEVEFKGNTLSIDPHRLLPGGIATIKGTTISKVDLVGILYFNGGEKFVIIDQRQFHIGQPVFDMLAKNIRSDIKSITLNPQIGPKLLLYTAATVVLRDM